MFNLFNPLRKLWGGTSSVLIIMSVVLIAVLAGCPGPDPVPGGDPDPVTVPAAPAAPTLNVGNAALTVTWAAPDNGGSAITEYHVQHKESTADWPADGTTNTAAIGGTVTSHTISGLDNTTSYDVRVRAVNAQGAGNWSTSAAATPSASHPPAPNTPTLVAGKGKLTVTWEMPIIAAGASAITTYHVQHKLSTASWPTDDSTDTATINDGTATRHVISGLIGGSSYDVRVRAENEDTLLGAWSQPATATPLSTSTVPAAPTAPTLEAGNASLRVTWTAPDDGGSAITGYNLRHSADGGTPWTPITSGITGTSHTITGLTNGASYHVQVRAVNAVGDGGWSESATEMPAIIISSTQTPAGTAATVSLSAASNAIITAESPTVALTVVEPGTLAVTESAITVTAATAPAGVAIPTVDSGTGMVTVTATTTAGTYLVYGSKAGDILFAEFFFVTVSPADNAALKTAVNNGITTWGTAVIDPAGDGNDTGKTGDDYTYADLNYIVTTAVTDMSEVFFSSTFNGDISGWDTSAATTMYRMFAGASAFNGDISGWDVSSVTNMYQIFAVSAFNGDISKWDTTAVTVMYGMFSQASTFNSDISAWNVSAVTNMSAMFKEASAFNGNISNWKTGAVTTMSNMFDRASAFNGNISGWDVSSVTNMLTMFYSASAFNQDLENWAKDANGNNLTTGSWNDGAYTGIKTNMFLNSGVTTPPSWY